MPSPRPLLWGALAVLALILVAPAASAKPAHKQALIAYFGPFLPPKLHDCRTCHLNGEGSTSMPRNPFGVRLGEIRSELRKAGKDTAIPARLAVAFDEDSDGDG